jgi:signal transduction histidine kinase
VHAKVTDRAETHSGLSIYRDGLRVMPYGRPENDFFGIEERRQSKAGREFWASRRLFGRIAISRKDNPNLRDKAGREGLIDNAASRAVQLLVIDLLKTAARRYFGGDSPIRQELLPAVEAENDAAADAAKKAQNSQLLNFRKTVRTQTKALDVAREQSARLSLHLKTAIDTNDTNTLWRLGNDVDALVSERTTLRLPPKPKKLGKFEDVFRDYRDRYSLLASEVDVMRETWNEAVAKLDAKPHVEIAQSHLGRNQKAITDQLSKWKRLITSLLVSENKRIDESVEHDGKEFYKAVAPLLAEVETQRVQLRNAIEEMDQTRDRLLQRFSSAYEPYLRAVTQLSEGLDLDGALAYGVARSDTLERRIEQIQSLAQIGISVEILSHELHSLDRRMANSLAALPQSVRDLPAFQSADSIRKELVERLRFLSQMQITDGDTQQKITGKEIADYLRNFFGTVLLENDVLLVATDEFCKAAFYEFPSRVFPVFINLVNNSLYWLSGCVVREIRLSAEAGTLLISDTGPGIDPGDIEDLFQLFFSRRVRGRGVGLYLCRQTLATGGHTIDYITDKAKMISSGANFAIKLRGGFDA